MATAHSGTFSCACLSVSGMAEASGSDRFAAEPSKSGGVRSRRRAPVGRTQRAPMEGPAEKGAVISFVVGTALTIAATAGTGNILFNEFKDVFDDLWEWDDRAWEVASHYYASFATLVVATLMGMLSIITGCCRAWKCAAAHSFLSFLFILLSFVWFEPFDQTESCDGSIACVLVATTSDRRGWIPPFEWQHGLSVASLALFLIGFFCALGAGMESTRERGVLFNLVLGSVLTIAAAGGTGDVLFEDFEEVDGLTLPRHFYASFALLAVAIMTGLSAVGTGCCRAWKCAGAFSFLSFLLVSISFVWFAPFDIADNCDGNIECVLMDAIAGNRAPPFEWQHGVAVAALFIFLVGACGAASVEKPLPDIRTVARGEESAVRVPVFARTCGGVESGLLNGCLATATSLAFFFSTLFPHRVASETPAPGPATAHPSPFVQPDAVLSAVKDTYSPASYPGQAAASLLSAAGASLLFLNVLVEAVCHRSSGGKLSASAWRSFGGIYLLCLAIMASCFCWFARPADGWGDSVAVGNESDEIRHSWGLGPLIGSLINASLAASNTFRASREVARGPGAAAGPLSKASVKPARPARVPPQRRVPPSPAPSPAPAAVLDRRAIDTPAPAPQAAVAAENPAVPPAPALAQ